MTGKLLRCRNSLHLGLSSLKPWIAVIMVTLSMVIEMVLLVIGKVYLKVR